jgi:hypothetical protein
MHTFHTYSVEFAYNDEKPQIGKFQAANVGHAQEKCFKDYPGAHVIEVWREGLYGQGITVYPPVSMAKVEPLPAVKTEEMAFAFFDECFGRRPRN